MDTAAENISGIENAGKNAKTVIRFEEGLYGFQTVKDYVLLQEDDTGTIWSLQAADGPVPSFIVLNPYTVIGDYSPVLPVSDYEALGSPPESDLCFLVIAVIAEQPENTVVNLKSPIVINVKARKGKQIIMEESDYPVRYRLFSPTGNPEKDGAPAPVKGRSC